MEYENALEAQMMEGHGPVEGLLHAIYTGEVNETVDGFLKFQLLKLGGAGAGKKAANSTRMAETTEYEGKEMSVAQAASKKGRKKATNTRMTETTEYEGVVRTKARP